MAMCLLARSCVCLMGRGVFAYVIYSVDLGGVFDETLLVNDAMCHAAN